MSELLTQRHGAVVVVQFASPKILSEVVISQVGRELLALADQADGGMLLDLSGVAFMSSAMIGKIILLNKSCKAKKTTVKVCNVSSNVMEVFELTRLNKVLSIYSLPEHALAAFDGRACPAGPPAADCSERAMHARHADGVGQSVAG
jgi:anti-sigma B factor antagonist